MTVADKAAIIIAFAVGGAMTAHIIIVIIAAQALRTTVAHTARAGMTFGIAVPAASLTRGAVRAVFVTIPRAASAAGEAAFFITVAVGLAVAALLVSVPAAIVAIGVPVFEVTIFL